MNATQLDAIATPPGNAFYRALANGTTPAAGAILPVGANEVLNVRFTPTDTSDFTSATQQVTINVTPKTLTAVIVGDPTKTYDGGTAASLTSGNFQLIGLVGSDSYTITQTVGVYNSKDTNAASISAALSPSNFTIGVGTVASNYRRLPPLRDPARARLFP